MFNAAADGEVSVWKVLFYVALAVGGIASAIFGKSEREKARSNIGRLATALGFSLVEPRTSAVSTGSHRIVGKRGGRTVDIYTRVEEHGHHPEKRGVVAMIVRNPRRLTLSIGRGLLPGLEAAFSGAKSVTTGDAEFDRTLQLRSNDPTYVAAALLPEVRQRMLAAARHGFRGGLAVEVGEIRYEEIGAFEDEKALARVQALVDMFSDLAEVIEAYHMPSGAPSTAAEKRHG